MTFQALQEYLDVVKWKDSEKIRADMCGRYARCRYCNRTEDFPCARAHNRLIEVQSSPVPDHIPDWLLPEPPVKEQFGEELASEDAPDAAPPSEERETAPENPQKTDQAEQIASETEKTEPDDALSFSGGLRFRGRGKHGAGGGNGKRRIPGFRSVG